MRACWFRVSVSFGPNETTPARVRAPSLTHARTCLQVQQYRQVAEAKDKRGFVFKLGPASEVLGVDFRRFQTGKTPEDVGFFCLYSGAVFPP